MLTYEEALYINKDAHYNRTFKCPKCGERLFVELCDLAIARNHHLYMGKLMADFLHYCPTCSGSFVVEVTWDVESVKVVK